MLLILAICNNGIAMPQDNRESEITGWFRNEPAGSAPLDKKPAMAGVQQGKTEWYTWYENGKARRIWLDRSMIAELGNRPETQSKPLIRAQGIRIWRQQDVAAARAKAHGQVSPVMRDAESGTMRVLAGNVIVRLNPVWSNEEVTSWLNANGLVEVKRLSVSANVLVIAARPGLASLELANRLQESGAVISAQPDWWMQREKR